jgi:prepilin-type N-terminal cleavage/methylation domain-containing protein
MGIALNRRNNGRKPSGLTLVELLVVIAMTAVLSALMFPALSTAKEKSRRAICASNIRQLLMIVREYADDNENYLPSCADDKGYYHSIVLSDVVFTNLVDLAGGNSNILYCPNIVFGSGPDTVKQHIPNVGYVIGYSYLEENINASEKAPDYTVLQKKYPAISTNELFADANYWVPSSASSSDYFKPQMKVAPHTAMGAAISQGSSFTLGLPGGSSASIGAVGGNIGFSDGSVIWRNLLRMQTNSASSALNDAYGIW